MPKARRRAEPSGGPSCEGARGLWARAVVSVLLCAASRAAEHPAPAGAARPLAPSCEPPLLEEAPDAPALGLVQHAAAAARANATRPVQNASEGVAARAAARAAAKPQPAAPGPAAPARRALAPVAVSQEAGRPTVESPHGVPELNRSATLALLRTLRERRSRKIDWGLIGLVLRHPEVMADFQDLNALGPGDEHLPEMAEKMHHILAVAPELRGQIVASMVDGGPGPLVDDGDASFASRLGRTALANEANAGALLDLLTSRAFMAEYVALNRTDPGKVNMLFFGRSERLQQIWNDAMMPNILFCRHVGIIGNVVLIAAACLISSAKSRSLSKQKLEQSSSANMERVLRRDITAAELGQHAVPGDMWLAVEGMVCDITDFTAVHPGGADLLLQYAGTDATEQFKEVGHSDFAAELIRARLKGVLVEGGEASAGAAQGEAKSGGVFERIKSRAKKVLPSQLFALFTREDPYNIHKVLGLAVIAHLLVRWWIALSGQWMMDGEVRDPMLFGSDWFSLASVWVCVLLQISSFQFVLPRNRVLGRPMLWQEWRAHNLIFVLRSLVAFTSCWIRLRYVTTTRGAVITTFICFLAVFGQLYFADVASRALRDSKHESLTASWPLWEGCPPLVERFLKFYYSIGINQLTSMSLSNQDNMMACFGGVLILQTDSFAMTLVRKNIISTARFHGYYLWNMWALAFLAQHTHGRLVYEMRGAKQYWLNVNLSMWGIPISVYIVRYLGLSKYGCWIGYMVKVLLMETTDLDYWTWLACPIVWSLWALGQLLLSGYVFEYRVRRFLEGGRAKPLVLRSRERVSGSLHRLCFDLPSGYACGMMPGQHMRVLTPNVSKDCKTWNGLENPEQGATDLSRSYTPISAPDSSTMEILVKHYARDATTGFPQGGRASSYLVEELQVGGEVLASGPHGQRIYFGNGLFEVEVGKPKIRPRACVVVAGGSGITPALSVLREIQAEAKRKADKREAWRMMDYENEVGITSFHVLHANRTMDDALPQSFYDDSSQKEQLVPVHVCNLATRAKAENEGQPIGNQERSEAQDGPTMRHGPLTGKLVSEVFPAPADDVLVILCGPHSFIVQLCQPLFRELGFRHVVAMW